MQSGIRELFCLVLVVAIFCAMTLLGWFVVLCCGASLAVLVWAWCSKRRGWWLFVRVAASVVSGFVIWLVAFDVTESTRHCQVCYSFWHRRQSSFLGVEFRQPETVHFPTYAELALEDMGVQCHHEDASWQFAHRLWGGFMQRPRGCTIFNLSGSFDYESDAGVFQAIRKDEPGFAKELMDHRRAGEFDEFWAKIDARIPNRGERGGSSSGEGE